MSDYLFGITWLTPLVFTIIVSVLTSTLSQLSFAFFTDKDLLNNSRNEMKKMQKDLTKMSPESKDYIDLQNKLLDLNMQLMTHSMKPTLVTMIPFLLIFMYAKSVVPVDQPLISLPFSLPLIGESFEFFGTYFITSIIFSSFLRKILRR
ncbi:MAG: DUF106 domain-containing protein [Nanoarchaeota archaeon]|nr:DUF106 domain-containing protein [Nanoarchaeota archaeon]